MTSFAKILQEHSVKLSLLEVLYETFEVHGPLAKSTITTATKKLARICS